MQAEQAPIAIIAGNGGLPFETAQALLSKGMDVYLIGIAGEVGSAIGSYPHTILEWGQIGALFRVLKEQRIQEILLIGGVHRRPEFSVRKIDFGALLMLPRLVKILLAGDNTILSGVIGIFEGRGIRVRGMAELLPELLVQLGANTPAKPRTRDIKRLEHGAAAIAVLGPYDIGQGAVLVGDRVVALEGVEGTDAMLKRVADLRSSGRLSARLGGVLVKRVKPGQDERADLPTIGPTTIENVHAAGLNGIGVEAGKTLIAERERTLELAKKLGVFIYGIELPDGGPT